ncbi:hypothetical protein GCM10011371_12570 [Novosphingobium marinum]|uniref:N-acetylmuramoyl-L-alanine amidase domain-containing protein n=1 Tax=Novosphingobium marinum TaxID=1514948 RepID=A0A7Y9XVH0_9SPHN|nr:peptidoglycan recognition family protein [Novosphingobium marinum]NYH95366.1 hypothetical protein [Novosphingobium marinum]GGC26486.1 hypothetical protein GCM10011371_12570 [Novosphingobium marinum]
MVQIIDRTAETAQIFQTRNGRNIFSHGRNDARRPTGNLQGVILHQTAFVSHDMARMNYIIANYIVMQDGRILKVRDPSMMLNSIGTNRRSIDIEFVGRYPDARTAHRAHGAGGPPPAQVMQGRALVKHLKETYGLTHVYAHVQFTVKNCPGPHLWYNVGRWAMDDLGMATASTPLPRGWDREELAVA